MKRTTVDDLHKKWLTNPKYRREYEALEEEFSLAAALICVFRAMPISVPN